MRLNCYGLVSIVGAPQSGSVSHTTCALCTSHASVKALEPSPLVSPLVIGSCSRVSGWQSYSGLGRPRSPYCVRLVIVSSPTLPSPCALCYAPSGVQGSPMWTTCSHSRQRRGGQGTGAGLYWCVGIRGPLRSMGRQLGQAQLPSVIALGCFGGEKRGAREWAAIQVDSA